MCKSRIEAEDEALLLACRQGDETAWATLVTRYQRLIYAIPRRCGLDEDLCADVFQRTFTLLWQHLARIEQPSRIRSWLVTTARREAAAVARRQRRLLPIETADDEQSEGNQSVFIDPNPVPDALLLQLEEQQIVRMTMTALDERCARLLTLLFYQAEPASYTEVAALLDLPAGSIGPTRARCLQKLRRLLEEEHFWRESAA